MVNEERLRHMIKMEAFEKHDGTECKPMTQYARRDYISMQMLRSFITGTIAFCMIVGMWALYEMETLMQEITTMDIRSFVINMILRYVFFLVIYEIATYFIFNMKYSAGRRKVKHYFNRLKKVNKMYEREERLKMPSGSDWN